MLAHAVVKSPAGGDYLSTQCRNYLTEKGIEIVPPSLVASKEVTKTDEPAIFKRRMVQSHLTDSWYSYMIKVYKKIYIYIRDTIKYYIYIILIL